MNQVQARRQRSLHVWGVWWVQLLCHQRMCRNMNFANVLSILPPDKCLTSWWQPDFCSVGCWWNTEFAFQCITETQEKHFSLQFVPAAAHAEGNGFILPPTRMFSLVSGRAVYTWTFISTDTWFVVALSVHDMNSLTRWAEGKSFWLIDWFFFILFFWACCLRNDFSQKLTKCSEAALSNLPLTGCNLTSSSTCHSCCVAWQWCIAAMSSCADSRAPCRVVHCCLCPTAPKKQSVLSNSTWTQLSKKILVNAAFITLDFQEVSLKLVSPAQLSNEKTLSSQCHLIILVIPTEAAHCAALRRTLVDSKCGCCAAPCSSCPDCLPPLLPAI